jgi:ankyrin repeat protein
MTSNITILANLANLANLARIGKLTVDIVNHASKDKFLTTSDGYTLLCLACMYCSVDVVETILDRGIVDINGTSIYNCTPLHGAVGHGQWKTTKLLLERGADATLATSGKWNALHFAAREDAPNEIINLLIDAGGDPLAKDSNNLTPAMIATRKKNSAVAEYFEQFCKPPTKSANFLA